MATAEKTVTRSEDILGEKWDKCVVDAGIKLSTGIVVGKNHTKLFIKSKFLLFAKILFYFLQAESYL